ncbi:hypothetical protein UlMin_024577 [Ulmus minor]
MQFIYVLPGWEGSTADSRVLRDALRRRNGLNVPHSYYYLVDAGYSNCNGFLAPYRGQHYHLSEWTNGRQPNNHQDFFNMKHSVASNAIEWCFGVLKNRWAVLRSHAFYLIKTQNRIIMAYCLLHNFIRKEMPNDPFDNVVDQHEEEINENDGYNDPISTIKPSDEWNAWRTSLANEMYNEWRNRH